MARMIEEYHATYYQESDGEVHEQGDDSGYQSGNLSNFKEDLSMTSNGVSNEHLELVKEIQPAPPAPNIATTTNTTSSSLGGGGGGQALAPPHTERKGAPSPQGAQKAGVGSSSSGAG